MSDKSETTDSSVAGDHLEGSEGLKRRTMRRQLAGLLIVIAALALVGDVLAGVALGRPSTEKPSSIITVTGSGTAHGTPDTVSFQIGVSTVAKSATAALSANNARVGSSPPSLDTASLGETCRPRGSIFTRTTTAPAT